jgi:hypothetical protein
MYSVGPSSLLLLQMLSKSVYIYIYIMNNLKN